MEVLTVDFSAKLANLAISRDFCSFSHNQLAASLINCNLFYDVTVLVEMKLNESVSFRDDTSHFKIKPFRSQKYIITYLLTLKQLYFSFGKSCKISYLYCTCIVDKMLRKNGKWIA